MKKHYSHKCSVNCSNEQCEFYYSFNNESLFCFLILHEWEQLIMLQINIINFVFQYKSNTIFISDRSPLPGVCNSHTASGKRRFHKLVYF